MNDININMIKLFNMFNVPVYMHWTFIVLCIFIVGNVGLLFSAALIVSLLMHEFGHVLVARRYGYETDSVVLFGMGAVANIVGEIRYREVIIAAAGPAVNFVLGLCFMALMFVLKSYSAISIEMLTFVTDLMWINVVVGLFNLMPMYPVDGGRIVHGVLTRFVDFNRATVIACNIGMFFGIMLCAYAVSVGMWFLLASGAFALLLTIIELRAARHTICNRHINDDS